VAVSEGLRSGRLTSGMIQTKKHSSGSGRASVGRMHEDGEGIATRFLLFHVLISLIFCHTVPIDSQMPAACNLKAWSARPV
jgi:hypothetical protein